MMMEIYPLVYVPRLANFCSNQLFSFLSIEKTDCTLGQDCANDGHGTWFRLCVDLFLRAGLHAAGSVEFVEPHGCFDPEELSSRSNFSDCSEFKLIFDSLFWKAQWQILYARCNGQPNKGPHHASEA
jgi:hypothetical protein